MTVRDHGERLLDDTIGAAALGIGADALPARARAVVVGGGIIGTSVARSLAELGWTDTVLPERHRLSSGTSWHPAGLLASARATHAQTRMAMDSTAAYAALEEQSGIDVGFVRRGMVTVARTADRMTELRYVAEMARHHGIDHELLGPGDLAAVHPGIETADLHGGVLVGADGTVNPGGATAAQALLAHRAGVTICEDAPVSELLVADGRITGVRTDRGDVEAEVVVLACGLWSAALARTAGVRLALHAAEHMWVMTAPVDPAVAAAPYLRDLDGHFYVRGCGDRLVVGAFEPDGKPRPLDTIPEGFAFGEFPPDEQHFALPLGKARERVPVLRDVPVERWLNAPESFTPDANPLLGETAEVQGLFVAAGLNSQGILLGPGVGRAVAEWVAAGTPQFDSAEADVRRFSPQQATAGYLEDRTRETLGRLYAMHWPGLQPESARGARRSPLYDRLAAAGACFGELNGWERAQWYGPPGERPVPSYSWGRPPWFEHVRVEHEAARNAVALFDLSSFGKTIVAGPGALRGLQRVSSADVDVPVGTVRYTTFLNAAGGIEVDLTVTRLAADRFLVVAPTVTQHAVVHRLRRHVPDAAVVDVTSGYGTLAVMGPRSRELLSRLSPDALDDAAFPYQSAREIDVAWAQAIALRVSFVGEMGWELYVPADGMAGVYDALVRAGADLGLRHAGYHALDSLRIEKGYRHWGADIGPADTPLETGLGFTVDWDGPACIGRDALAARRGAPHERRLVALALEDPEPVVYHGESVLRDGEIVGKVTSGAWGYTLGRAAMLALVHEPGGVSAESLAAGRYEVDVAGERVPARAQLGPWYDPAGERMRG